MKTQKWVISLGGSRIIPEDVDNKFLSEFKKLILNSKKSHKFIVVTGGGTTARKYITALKEMNKSIKEQSKAGIAVTRFHASFLMRLFGKRANHELPFTIKRVKNLITKNKVVFCGALRSNKKQTTDGTAAKIAASLNCPFINLTNVKGLYTNNPKTHKNAKFIKDITWSDFNKMAKKIKFKAGQHFVLDQVGAKVILRRKVPTYIVGSSKDIKNVVNNKKFTGTLINN
jgi:uridylate kinase